MGWLIQQYLPKVELPTFSGAPLDWVNFIVKFRDIVHKQRYLNNGQRSHLLLQHLKGDAARSVKSFSNDPRGYVWSLKKLKYLFGQRPDVAKATLERVTKGKAIQNDDLKGLMELYYSITDCLTTLKQLNYESDLCSSDTLRQVLQRLPRSLQMKWGEHSMRIRRHVEPSLIHLEEWLQARVLARKEAGLHASSKKDDAANKDRKKGDGDKFTGNIRQDSKCQLCSEAHPFWRCPKYKNMKVQKRWEYVKKEGRCFNCFQKGHKNPQCTSQNTCFETGCNEKHHTSLHQYFIERGGKRKAEENAKKAAAAAKAAASAKAAAAAADNDKKEEAPPNEEPATKEKVNANVTKPEDDESAFAGSTTRTPKDVYLQIVPLKLHGCESRTINTYGLLDNGSQRTWRRDWDYKEGIRRSTWGRSTYAGSEKTGC